MPKAFTYIYVYIKLKCRLSLESVACHDKLRRKRRLARGGGKEHGGDGINQPLSEHDNSLKRIEPKGPFNSIQINQTMQT